MPRLSRKESQEATRSALRRAAAEEFARRGVSGASIDMITETAGFSRGAFYSNYASKHDLLLELLQRVARRELAAWQEMIESAESLDVALPALARQFDAFVAESNTPLTVELRLEALRNPVFGRHYAESSAELFQMVVEMVRRLVERAGRSADDVMPFALALRAMATGLELDASARTEGPSGGEIMALFLRRMLRS